MSTFPTLPQPGAQMGTVPGGGTASMNMNPLGSSPMTTAAAASPVAATLPGGVQPIYGTVPGGTTATNTTQAATGGFNPSSGAGVNTATQEAGDHTLEGDLQAIYGRGTGTAVANVLGGLGTSTSIAEKNMTDATMAAAQQGWGNVAAGMGARGVSADSSTAGLAAGDYWGNVSQGIAQMTGQIGLQEENTLINALTQTGQEHGADVSGWDTFGNVMSGLGSAAVGLGEAYLTGGMAGGSSIKSGLSSIFGGSSGATKANASSSASALGGLPSYFLGA